MLKFADLSVDMKSFENTMDSFMKIFPNSYMPLLIMYLSREDMIKIEEDVDKDDKRVLLQTTKQEVADFLGINISLLGKKQESQKVLSSEDLDEVINKKNLDIYMFSSLLKMVVSFENTKTYSMVIDCDSDNVLLQIKDIFIKNQPSSNEGAALWFFYSMIQERVGSYYEKAYIKGTNKEDNFWKSEWVSIFDQTIGKIQRYSGFNENIQPAELTKLVLTKRHGGSIYNPFAGLASYAVQLTKPCGEDKDSFFQEGAIGDYYYADEINELTWAIGKLRLMAYSCDSNNYELGDSTEPWEGEVNNVICTPPFGLKITNEEGKKEFADNFVIRRGLDFVVEDGLVACVVPASFLYRKDTEKVRKTIIDNKWLEALVYLPEDVFKYTSIRTAILFIRKSEHSYVTIVDGTSSIRLKGKYNILDDEKIANLLCLEDYDPQSPYYDSDFRMEDVLSVDLFHKLRGTFSFEDIINNGYSLIQGEFFTETVDEVEGFKLVRLDSLIESQVLTSPDCNHMRVVTPSMLSKDAYTPLDVDGLDFKEIDSSYKLLNGNSLIISPIGALRPTLFVREKEDVAFRNNNLFTFTIHDDKVYPFYLVNELSKDYVKDQLRYKYFGDAVSRLSLEGFLSIYVRIPDNESMALENEKEIFDNEKFVHYARLGKDLNKMLEKRHDEYVKMLRQRKHRIQQLMNEFSPAFSLLNQYRKENGGVLHNNDIVAQRTGKTVDDYFNKLESIAVRIEDLVTSLIDKEKWGALVSIDISDFINEIPNHHISDKYVFQIYEDNEEESYFEGIMSDFEKLTVSINPDDLTTVFENIISNAREYGFTDDKRNDYVVRIKTISCIVDNQPSVTINISNNGTPIHPSVDRSRIFEWGYGTKTGIGTWQVKSIIEHYGGSVKLNEYPDEEAGFQTELEIVLPLVKSEKWKSKLG